MCRRPARLARAPDLAARRLAVLDPAACTLRGRIFPPCHTPRRRSAPRSSEAVQPSTVAPGTDMRCSVRPRAGVAPAPAPAVLFAAAAEHARPCGRTRARAWRARANRGGGGGEGRQSRRRAAGRSHRPRGMGGGGGEGRQSRRRAAGRSHRPRGMGGGGGGSERDCGSFGQGKRRAGRRVEESDRVERRGRPRGGRRAPGPRGPSTGTRHARGGFPLCGGKAKHRIGGSGGGGAADPPRICPAGLCRRCTRSTAKGRPILPEYARQRSSQSAVGLLRAGRRAWGGRQAGGGTVDSRPIEPLDPRCCLPAGRHASRLAVAWRRPAPVRRIAAPIANAAGRRIAGHASSSRNVQITLPASAQGRPGRAASSRSRGTAAAGSVNRRACGRRSKPAIASGCDPIPFRTWKSNLASLSCY